MAKVFVPETTVTIGGSYSDKTGWKTCKNVPDLSFLTPGETYIVNFCFDGVCAEYRCLCKSFQKHSSLTVRWIGNGLEYEDVDSGEPFLIADGYSVQRDQHIPSMHVNPECGTEATFSIYQNNEQPEDEEGFWAKHFPWAKYFLWAK